MGYSPWGHKESDTTEQLTGGTCLEEKETASDITAEVPRGPKNQQCLPPGLQGQDRQQSSEKV